MSDMSAGDPKGLGERDTAPVRGSPGFRGVLALGDRARKQGRALTAPSGGGGLRKSA